MDMRGTVWVLFMVIPKKEEIEANGGCAELLLSLCEEAML